jgi:hypothetical protein
MIGFHLLHYVKEITCVEGYKVRIKFNDGIEGLVDLSELIDFTGIFKALKDKEYFAQVSVHDEFGTICWPNGADLDPVVLYSKVTGKKTRFERI